MEKAPPPSHDSFACISCRQNRIKFHYYFRPERFPSFPRTYNTHKRCIIFSIFSSFTSATTTYPLRTEMILKPLRSVVVYLAPDGTPKAMNANAKGWRRTVGERSTYNGGEKPENQSDWTERTSQTTKAVPGSDKDVKKVLRARDRRMLVVAIQTSGATTRCRDKGPKRRLRGSYECTCRSKCLTIPSNNVNLSGSTTRVL